PSGLSSSFPRFLEVRRSIQLSYRRSRRPDQITQWDTEPERERDHRPPWVSRGFIAPKKDERIADRVACNEPHQADALPPEHRIEQSRGKDRGPRLDGLSLHVVDREERG